MVKWEYSLACKGTRDMSYDKKVRGHNDARILINLMFNLGNSPDY